MKKERNTKRGKAVANENNTVANENTTKEVVSDTPEAEVKATRKPRPAKETKETKETKKPSSDFSLSDIAGAKSLSAIKFEIFNELRKTSGNRDYRINFRNRALQKITGGIIGGTFAEIGASSQGGKSFLLYEQMAVCQEMGGVVILNDGEGAFDEAYAKMVGIDINSGTFMYFRESDIQKVYGFYVNLVQEIRKKKKLIPILIGQDSFPTLNTSFALKARVEGKQLGHEAELKNRAWSEQMETFTPFLKEHMATHIMLNQFTQVGVNSYTGEKIFHSLCENKMQYWTTQRLKGKLVGELVKEFEVAGKKVKSKIGARTMWESIKNRAVKPFQKATIDIRYSRGIDTDSGIIKHLLDTQFLNIRSSKFDVVTGEELPKPAEYLVGSSRFLGEGAEDFKMPYLPKSALLTERHFIEKLIEHFPKAIEPIKTGQYDDGEPDSVVEKEDSAPRSEDE